MRFFIEWGREAGRVDFMVADNVDMTLFSNNAYVMFTFEVQEGSFTIVSAMAMSKTDSALSAPKDTANDEGQ